MPRLFLASSIDQTLHHLSQKARLESDKTKVAFVENGSDPYRKTSDLFWVKNDRNRFLELGYQIENLDMNDYVNKPHEKIESTLSEFDIIHFCGGHTRYLLYLIHKTGLFKPVSKLVQANKLLYTSTSAGSTIAGPTLNGLGRLDNDIDPDLLDEINGHSLEGLNLVNFLILPHFNNPDFIPANTETITSTEYPYPFIFLNDQQAIWIENDKLEIITH